MSKFEIGDRVQMPGVPFAVTVTGLGECDADCGEGKETFSFQDPGGQGEDWAHTSEFERVAG